jgi:hypothetical protein
MCPPQTALVALTDGDPTDDGPAVLSELASIVAQMIEPDTLPPGMC